MYHRVERREAHGLQASFSSTPFGPVISCEDGSFEGGLSDRNDFTEHRAKAGSSW